MEVLYFSEFVIRHNGAEIIYVRDCLQRRRETRACIIITTTSCIVYVPIVFGRNRQLVLLGRWHAVTRVLRESVGRGALLVRAGRVAARVRGRAVRCRVPVGVLGHRVSGMRAQRRVTCA